MIPRSYQLEAVDHVWDYFRNHTSGNPLIAMPTATGKSVVIALFVKSVLDAYPGQRIMVLTHVKELIVQNYSKLLKVWPFAPAGVYSAGLNKRDVTASVTFAGIGSVGKRAAEFGRIDLVLIDEAHLLSPDDGTLYQKFIAALKTRNPYLRVIGLTATPYRMGQGKLTDATTDRKGNELPSLFTDICFDLTNMSAFNRLIAEGFLAPVISRKTELQLDTDGVHMRGGDFMAGELEMAVNRDGITERAILEARELGHDRKSWIAFASGVQHAIDTAAMLNHMGISAIAIHGSMGKERDRAIAAFKAGQFRCAVSNNVLTTGFDHPPVDMILGLRPTMSVALWVQMIGRGTRTYDPANPGDVNPHVFDTKKENCLVLDFAKNVNRLGPINDPVVPRRRGAGGGDAPIKECPACGCMVHASLRFCNGERKDGTACDHEFAFVTKLTQTSSTDDMIKGDLPITEVFKVDHVSVVPHVKAGNTSMRVTYYCGFKSFEEFICFEHPGYAGKKARNWWRERSDTEVPATVNEAIEDISSARMATHLRIWINKKYPEILAHCLDGTAFGTGTPVEPPKVTAPGKKHAATTAPEDSDYKEIDPDDDIPF